MKILVVKGNIVDSDCEAIVNAANEQLNGGAGVCGAIFNAAGWEQLQHECDLIGTCRTGYAVITKGYNLKAKYIIHAVGPVYRNDASEKYLAMAYYNALKVANENNIKSIAFPSISTGIYGYPLNKAVPIAIKAINDFFKDYPNSTINEVQIVAFDSETYDLYYESLNKSNSFNLAKEILQEVGSIDYAVRPFYLMYLNKVITKDQLLNRLSYFVQIDCFENEDEKLFGQIKMLDDKIERRYQIEFENEWRFPFETMWEFWTTKLSYSDGCYSPDVMPSKLDDFYFGKPPFYSSIRGGWMFQPSMCSREAYDESNFQDYLVQRQQKNK